jgi:predicted dehydrogenase
MPPLGLCIVGCGRFAGLHARAARELGRAVGLSFASRDPTVAEAYRRRFRGTAAFGSYEAAAADPRVDALLFSTPHDQHLANVQLAARYRKAVLLEKPIARTLEEADAAIAAAEGAGITLMVAENVHFMPAFRAARRLVRRGAIGAVRHVLISARVHREPSGWRRQREAVGGGSLIDGGIHYVHALREWGGPVARVAAAAPPGLFPGVEGEDTACVLLSFRSGAVGMLVHSLAAPGAPRTQEAWVTGTAGSLGVDSRGRYLVLRGRGGPRRTRVLRDPRGLATQLREFVAAVRGRRPPALLAREARQDLAVVLAAYRSIETGESVALGTDARGCEKPAAPRRAR